MQQNRTLILVVVAALLLAVALGLIFRGVSEPTPPAPVPIDTLGSGTPDASKREPPKAPTDVSSGSVVKTKSELEFVDIVVGTGASPQPGSVVVVEYTGWLLTTRKMFDSSYNQSDPFRFVIGRGNVIAGWDEGVMSMKIGGTRQLIIPSDLAYGRRGAGRDIPPDSDLIFEVKLLEVGAPRIAPEAPVHFANAEFTETESSLRYKDIVLGSGQSVRQGDTVRVEYTGWLSTGMKFDSSFDREDAVEFEVGKVIAGWNEGLQGMKVGGKRQLVIPPKLGYGKASIPPQAPPDKVLIPPNSTLIFEVEVLGVR